MAIAFTDNFTVAANTPLNQYPSVGSPDYTEYAGQGQGAYVNATNDRVQNSGSGATAFTVAKCINAAVPTGDQEITASCTFSPGVLSELTLRGNTSNEIAYLATLNGTTAVVELYYSDASSGYTLLNSWNDGLATGAHTIRFKATGTSPVLLEVQVDGGTTHTHSDSTYLLASGYPGFNLYNVSVGDLAYIDNLSISSFDTTPVYCAWVTA